MGKSKKPEIATVIAPYQATSKEQLSLQRGQLIMIRKKTTSGWWEGETHVRYIFVYMYCNFNIFVRYIFHESVTRNF